MLPFSIPMPSLYSCAKVLIATSVIVFASWLAGRKPQLAGFITALPIVSMVAIAFSYMDHKDVSITASYDVNTSALSNASRGNGAFELSLAYRQYLFDSPGQNGPVGCPTF